METPTSEASAAGSGWRPDLRRSVVRICEPSGRVAGTGFVIDDRLIVTCAHVVAVDGGPPDEPVSVEAPQASSAVLAARVDADLWRGPNREDIAFLRCDGPLPEPIKPLPLGASDGARGHRVASFGYPVNAPGDGHYGYGRAGGEIRGDSGSRLMQVTECSEVTEGFSGGPVLDEVTGLVIGMVDSVAAVDRLGRGGATAYVTLIETLRAICPDLTFSELCPYRGLDPFTGEHAEWFFGRERAIDAVLARLREDSRIVALLGPSGSGKSSLVNAGVVPAVQRGGLPGSDRWGVVVTVPAELTGEPLAAVAAAELAAHPECCRVVFVLDQCEQLLMTADAGRRDAVLAELAELADHDPAVTVILVMRDDFYGRLAAAAPQLMHRLERAVVNIPPVLERDDLAAIVEGPAERVGLGLEPQLTERIVADAVTAAPPGSPGRAGAATTVMPLLEFTLTELWSRRDDGRLTHGAYDSLDGVTGGLSDWCERTYQSLPERLRPVAQRVLTALIEPADGTTGIPPVSRRRTIADLTAISTPAHAESDASASQSTPSHDADEVLARLSGARLIVTRQDHTTGQATAELIHDALIREWARLREWLEQDRDFLAWRNRVDAQYRRWSGTGDTAAVRDRDLLLRGRDLDAAIGWCKTQHVHARIRRFVEQSSEAEQRRRSRARWRVRLLASLTILTLTTTVIAASFAYRAERQEKIATSRALAAQASALLTSEPDLAHLLALESLRTATTQESLSSIRSLLSHPMHVSRQLTGHDDGAMGVAFSPDGSLLASGGGDGTVRLWDPVTGEQVGDPLTGHADTVWTASFSPDGSLLASGGGDGTVRLWDPITGEQVGDPLTGHSYDVFAVAFSPDGKVLASAGTDGALRLWNPVNGDEFSDPPTGLTSSILDVTFSPDGNVLASVDIEGAVRLWDPVTGDPVGDPLSSSTSARAVAFSPDGGLLASAGRDVWLWDPVTGEQVGDPLTGHERGVTSVAFSSDGDLLASADSDGTVRLWDPVTGEQVGNPLTGHDAVIEEVALSPDGRLIASASRDGTLRLSEVNIGKPVGRSLTGDEGSAWGLALSPAGRLLALANDDGTIRLWDTGTGDPVGDPLAGHTTAVIDVAFSPDGSLLASGGEDGTVRLWDPVTGEQVGDPLISHENEVRNVAFSSDGDLLAAADGGGSVRLWDPVTGEQVGDPLTGRGGLWAVAFSPDVSLLAAIGDDGTQRLWDPATGNPVGVPLARVGWVNDQAFSPDGDLLASADIKSVRLWDPVTGDLVGDPLTGHERGVTSVAFSPDGDLLASADTEGTVRLWDPVTGDLVGDPLTGHTGRLRSLAFSSDGELLATASADDTVRLWATPATWTTHACRRAGRNLTQDEWDEYLGGATYARTCPEHPTGIGAHPDAPAGEFPSLHR